MITYLKIDGFKSFQQFEMEFTPFTVIAGANAAGKSNLFDALKLLSDLADADKIQKAFRGQRGILRNCLLTMMDNQVPRPCRLSWRCFSRRQSLMFGG